MSKNYVYIYLCILYISQHNFFLDKNRINKIKGDVLYITHIYVCISATFTINKIKITSQVCRYILYILCKRHLLDKKIKEKFYAYNNFIFQRKMP